MFILSEEIIEKANLNLQFGLSAPIFELIEPEVVTEAQSKEIRKLTHLFNGMFSSVLSELMMQITLELSQMENDANFISAMEEMTQLFGEIIANSSYTIGYLKRKVLKLTKKYNIKELYATLLDDCNYILEMRLAYVGYTVYLKKTDCKFEDIKFAKGFAVTVE